MVPSRSMKLANMAFHEELCRCWAAFLILSLYSVSVLLLATCRGLLDSAELGHVRRARKIAHDSAVLEPDWKIVPLRIPAQCTHL